MAIYLPRDPRDALLQQMGEKIGQSYTDARVKNMWKKGIEGGDSIESVYAKVSSRNPELADKLMMAEKKKRLNARLDPVYRKLERDLGLPEGTIKDKAEYDIYANERQRRDKKKLNDLKIQEAQNAIAAQAQSAQNKARILAGSDPTGRQTDLLGPGRQDEARTPIPQAEMDRLYDVEKLDSIAQKRTAAVAKGGTGTWTTEERTAGSVLTPDQMEEFDVKSGELIKVRINNKTNEVVPVDYAPGANQDLRIKNERAAIAQDTNTRNATNTAANYIRSAVHHGAFTKFRPARAANTINGLVAYMNENDWGDYRVEENPSHFASVSYSRMLMLDEAYKAMSTRIHKKAPEKYTKAAQKEWYEEKRKEYAQMKEKLTASFGSTLVDNLWPAISSRDAPPEADVEWRWRDILSTIRAATRKYGASTTPELETQETPLE